MQVFELALLIAAPFALLGLQLMLLTDSNGNLAQAGYASSYMFSGTIRGAPRWPLLLCFRIRPPPPSAALFLKGILRDSNFPW